MASSSNFFVIIFTAIAEVLRWLFGGKRDKVELKDHIFTSLFFPRPGGPYVNGTVDGTWGYLNLTKNQQADCRKYIKANAADGETPAILFLLTPSAEAGMIFNPFPTVDANNLKRATEAIELLVKDGIAVFPTLYTDDQNPVWWDIEHHRIGWSTVHAAIGKHVNGYVLSIEGNERVTTLAKLEACITSMRTHLPGVDYYCAHMQFNSKSTKSSYRWNNQATVPKNIDILFVENSWPPQRGDTVGLAKAKSEYLTINGAIPANIKRVFHEYNINPSSNVYKEQRQFLRDRQPFGVS